MRVYRVNGIEHKVFDPDDILPEGLVVQSDWKKGNIGDWVKADDDCIIEVLRKGAMKRQKGRKREVAYIGTCTGTFPAYSSAKMDTSRRINIYSFGGGRLADDVLIERENLSKHEQVFVVYLASGLNAQDAYMKAFPTNNPGYAKFKSAQLVKTTRVRTAMKEELKPVMEELDLDETFVLKNIKEVILSSEKDDTRLKALFKLADIMDMEDKTRTNTTTLAVGAFKGFSDNVLEEAKRPKELK
tara:strand:+ start:2753 stop:3481 length:729 start_codon:yes stop_codon:yes gene_type:complete